MKTMFVVVAAAGLLLAGPAYADAFKDSGCVKCHDAEKKKMGPSVKDMAARLKGKADEAALVAKLSTGKGHPKQKGSEAELKAALQEILK